MNPDTTQTRTSSLADGALLVRRRDHLVEVVFNRPERHNAFTSGTYEGLLEICAEPNRMTLYSEAGQHFALISCYAAALVYVVDLAAERFDIAIHLGDLRWGVAA